MAVVALARLLGVVLLRAAHEPRLDAELAQPQALVGAELDLRPREQRHALAPRVLEQVAGQLLAQLALVAREDLPILAREPHHVLVGRVGARQRLDGVLVHLLRELAGDLDGPHLGLEGAAEGPLNEAGELLFQAAQHAHERRLPTRRRREPSLVLRV